MNLELSSNVKLSLITMDQYSDLLSLMTRIYPPAYKYLWKDDGAWYLEHIYGKEQVHADINEKDSHLYFVIVDDIIEGILKVQIDIPYPDQPKFAATRLHRIYLSENVQGKGISKLLMAFVNNLARENGSMLLWLDCMDSKTQALKYYEKNGFKKGTLSQLPYDGLLDEYRGIYLMWKLIR